MDQQLDMYDVDAVYDEATLTERRRMANAANELVASLERLNELYRVFPVALAQAKAIAAYLTQEAR